MSAIGCFLWWILFGALLGWLASWLLGRGTRREPELRERIVEKIVDRPFEKLVDNPIHLTRIRELEAQVGTIAGLQTQLAQLRAAPPKVVEKIVDRPVERVVEKIVEKPVDRVVEKIVDRPVEVERIVEKFVDRPVDKLVDNPAHLARIRELEVDVARLRAPPAIDIPAARAAGFTLRTEDDLEIIEGIGPKIAQLLRADGITTFARLADMRPEQIRAILDRAGPSFRVNDPGTWPEQADLAARNRWTSLRTLQDTLVAGVRVDGRSNDAQLKETRAQLAARDAELLALRTPVPIDVAAAHAAGFDLKGPDDLEIIEGIGPKIAELLRADGITTFAQLASRTPQQIQPILERAGARFALAKPDTWPEQADLAARNRWLALKALQDVLDAGNR